MAGQRLVTEIGEFDGSGWPSGATVEVMLRPADVRLHARPDGEGEVVSRHFRGADNAYDVRLPSGTLLRCSLPAAQPLPVGARVRVESVSARAVTFAVADAALQC